MAELPPLAQVQQRQLVPYNNAGQVPIAGVNGGGELATLAQAIGQGATSIAQGFEPSTMAMRYQNAMNYAPMSNTERLLTIMPAADIIGGGFLAGAKVPRNALASNAVRREGAETLPEVEEIIAYHGSPHNFDKFQMDKLGTGEGAQAYGHGLYFADLEKVAGEYEKALTPRDLDYEEWLMGKYKQAENAQDYNRLDMYERALLHDKPSDFRSIADDADYDDDYRALASEVADEIEEYGPKFGATYKVSIQSKLDDMLDYDAPISEQSEKVQRAWEKLAKSKIGKRAKHVFTDIQNADGTFSPVGNDFLRVFSEGFEDVNKIDMTDYKQHVSNYRKAATEFLKKEGITGINYLDGNSRGLPYEIKLSTKQGPYDTEKITASSKKQAEQLASEYKEKGFGAEVVKTGTHNYVVFDENLIKILAKYGIVGGVGLAAANEFSSPAQADSYPNYMPPQAPELDANPVQPRTMRPNEA